MKFYVCSDHDNASGLFSAHITTSIAAARRWCASMEVADRPATQHIGCYNAIGSPRDVAMAVGEVCMRVGDGVEDTSRDGTSILLLLQEHTRTTGRGRAQPWKVTVHGSGASE